MIFETIEVTFKKKVDSVSVTIHQDISNEEIVEAVRTQMEEAYVETCSLGNTTVFTSVQDVIAQVRLNFGEPILISAGCVELDLEAKANIANINAFSHLLRINAQPNANVEKDIYYVFKNYSELELSDWPEFYRNVVIYDSVTAMMKELFHDHDKAIKMLNVIFNKMVAGDPIHLNVFCNNQNVVFHNDRVYLHKDLLV